MTKRSRPGVIMTLDLTANLMAQLFDVTSDAIIVIDARQNIVRFNRGAEAIFSYGASEVMGRPLDILLPERFVSVHRVYVQAFGGGSDRARDMGARQDVWGRRKDGSEFPAAAGITKLEQDQQQMFAVVLRDVSEQRRLQEEARVKATEAAIAAERSRLARDLHDAVTQSLFSVSLMAEVLPQVWEGDRAKGLAQLQDMRQLARSALAEMRTLLLELRPAAITNGKLGDLLAQLVEATRCRSGIDMTLSADERQRLPGDVQVAFYRITQEALHNVAKHSRARHAAVQLSVLPRHAMLLVHDDGDGFEFKGIGPTHFGLRIMRERAEEVGATLSIESAPARGTDVLVHWSETCKT